MMPGWEPADPPDPPEQQRRFGGPATCPGSCEACDPEAPPDNDGDPLEAHVARHHFQTDLLEFATQGNETAEPAELGLGVWYVCKHCSAWAEDLPEIDAAADFVLHGPGGP